jgi:hypothetical protein
MQIMMDMEIIQMASMETNSPVINFAGAIETETDIPTNKAMMLSSTMAVSGTIQTVMAMVTIQMELEPIYSLMMPMNGLTLMVMAMVTMVMNSLMMELNGMTAMAMVMAIISMEL